MNTDTTARLAEIRKELSGILEARMAELLALMKDMELETRQIASTELEIARLEKLKDQLVAERARLAQKVTDMNLGNEAYKTQNEDIQAALEVLKHLLPGIRLDV